MTTYKNMMETLVENKVNELMNQVDCCKCDKCKMDIIAFALNKLPTKYVASEKGEVYSKIYTLSVQHEADVMSAVMQGFDLVKGNPRHE